MKKRWQQRTIAAPEIMIWKERIINNYWFKGKTTRHITELLKVAYPYYSRLVAIYVDRLYSLRHKLLHYSCIFNPHQRLVIQTRYRVITMTATIFTPSSTTITLLFARFSIFVVVDVGSGPAIIIFGHTTLKHKTAWKGTQSNNNIIITIRLSTGCSRAGLRNTRIVFLMEKRRFFGAGGW